MTIPLKQYGITLSSRQSGKEAYNSIAPMLAKLAPEDLIEIDFIGISSFSPSWGDEFLSPLLNKFGDRLILINTKNLSVDATIELLQDISGLKFNRKS